VFSRKPKRKGERVASSRNTKGEKRRWPFMMERARTLSMRQRGKPKEGWNPSEQEGEEGGPSLDRKQNSTKKKREMVPRSGAAARVF